MEDERKIEVDLNVKTKEPDQTTTWIIRIIMAFLFGTMF